MGNTLVKWQVRRGSAVTSFGRGLLESATFIDAFAAVTGVIDKVEVSSVASEQRQEELVRVLRQQTSAPIRFHQTEAQRNGLVCAYQHPLTMGADRWHALYGCWLSSASSFIIVDAGSAITVDVVGADGRHLGGYILPGHNMMLRSLRQDTARVGFEDRVEVDTKLGVSTSECVHHGLQWLWQGLVGQVGKIAEREGIQNQFVTGGDAGQILALGLKATHVPDIVLDGLAAIVTELDQR